MKGGDHAPILSGELLGRGHKVRGFGAPPGAIPRSRIDMASQDDGLGVMAFRPDVVVVYDVLSPAGLHGARCAAKLGVPLIAVEEGFAGRGGLWEGTRRFVGEKLWGRYVRKRVDTVVALDDFAKGEALRHGFDGEKVHVLGRGVDLEQFRPGLTSDLAASHGAHGLSLLYLGSLDEGYHLETVIQAFAATVGQREDWSLLLAGDGLLREAFLAHASRLGVGGRVHWLDQPRAEELPGLLGASTLLVAPGGESVRDGLIAVRALACGLPILGANLPRYTCAVQDGHTGLLIEPGDAKAWGQAIRLAAGSPRRREIWGRNARELAEQEFHWSHIAHRFETLIWKAIESRAQQGASKVAPADSAEGQPLGASPETSNASN
ncbi:MAG: glycosyltransferase family 4 protein [Planctomycetes bacterium]|nr:glycosyltransferase family 4 protein [Planctomycetota bacterium]